MIEREPCVEQSIATEIRPATEVALIAEHVSRELVESAKVILFSRTPVSSQSDLNRDSESYAACAGYAYIH